MPIGIISAMKEEIQTLLDELDLKSTHEIGKRVYYKGFLCLTREFANGYTTF